MPELVTSTEAIAGVPALLVSAGAAVDAARRGTALLGHGLRARKELNQRELEQIAERGYLAIGLDQWGHGERRTREADAFLDGDHAEFPRRFLEAVCRGADEIPAVLDALEARGLAHPGRIAMTGISMGGYLTYRSVVRDARLRIAVPLLGAPRWRAWAEESPAHHPEAFESVALLSIVGGLDVTVPPGPAREFHALLAEQFPHARDRHAFIEYPESEHTMREADWHDAIRRMLDWFDRWMGSV